MNAVSGALLGRSHQFVLEGYAPGFYWPVITTNVVDNKYYV